MDVNLKRPISDEESTHSIPTSVAIAITPQTPEKIAWRMCKFTNPARSDKLVLSHWERINVSSKAVSNDEVLPVYDEQNIVRHEYRFAKFNPVIKVYRYSDEFYNSHLKDDLGDWTRAETDWLMDLCETFELKFVIIHDKIKQKMPVTMEQVKQKYYSIAKKLMEHTFEERIRAEASKYKSLNHPAVVSIKEERNRHPMIKYTYNYEQDRERRNMFDRQYRISPESRQKEVDLVEEITKLELKIRKEEKKPFELKRLKKKFGVNQEDIIPTIPLHSIRPSKGASLASACVANHKAKLTPKNDETINKILESMNIQPPIVSSLAANELYCLIRSDAGILSNIRNKVESLSKELEHWKAIAAASDHKHMHLSLHPPAHGSLGGIEANFAPMTAPLQPLTIKTPEPAFDYTYLTRIDPRTDANKPDLPRTEAVRQERDVACLAGGGFYPSPADRSKVSVPSPQSSTASNQSTPQSQSLPQQLPQSHTSGTHPGMQFNYPPGIQNAYGMNAGSGINNMGNGMNMQQMYFQHMHQKRLLKVNPDRAASMMIPQNQLLSPNKLSYHISPSLGHLPSHIPPKHIMEARHMPQIHPHTQHQQMQQQGAHFGGKMPPLHLQQQFIHGSSMQSPKIIPPGHIQPSYIPPLYLPPPDMLQNSFHPKHSHPLTPQQHHHQQQQQIGRQMQFKSFPGNLFPHQNFHPGTLPGNHQGNISGPANNSVGNNLNRQNEG
ncbi:DNA methyltransferase 1-associated protein 1 [Babesia microti strain RI]|uniref:DNA methyltransferase 1-associated protein 1 n=1 Tax=Babesia microti (strain RI) TaxID=1133968 RepID=I7JDU8_BABMR|nr:DNA methyltransferase 1-associated protein 1 [Babesia microti strain RI]CCF76020.2 DNA methyltransferase 1-associated protein 1 [Babesia microti strain RI]|eukprot:XP_021337211.1 DNA methyltransferase 1-associated protein 1 [Babesia microti strain RI]